MPKYIKPVKISLANNKTITESWIQARIAEDPGILGLGDFVLKDKERPQPNAGRLDLLLQDPENNRRYEVEVQLGKLNESHIIRTLEYWDIERKRYPQYDHCAVIIAEDINSRFLNVINLFNGSIPIIAIKMEAYQYAENEVSLIFTTILDELTLGLVDEDEEISEVADRNYWVARGSESTVKMAEELSDLINQFSENIELKYNKFYIGLAKEKQPFNFASFVPRRSVIVMQVKLPFSEETQNAIETNGFDDMGYYKPYGIYRLRLTKSDLKNKVDFISDLLRKAYENFR